MLVGGVVVGDQMDIEVRHDLPVDPVEKADELLVPGLLHALADHRAVEHVERGEKGGGAVARRMDVQWLFVSTPQQSLRENGFVS